jgi:hypothetical protein
MRGYSRDTQHQIGRSRHFGNLIRDKHGYGGNRHPGNVKSVGSTWDAARQNSALLRLTPIGSRGSLVRIHPTMDLTTNPARTERLLSN